MPKKIYLDESGDLGWTFNSPYRNGGSSRYLTIAYIIIPEGHQKYIERFVRSMYTKFEKDPKKEFKATTMSDSRKCVIAGEIMAMLNKHPDFVIGSITVMKERVMGHIRNDSNKLYNYMIGQCILPKIHLSPAVALIRDNRTVKVQSGNSCIDYLQIKLYFDYSSPTKIKDYPTESHQDLGVIFIDWVTNFVWAHYEDSKDAACNILSAKLIDERLYF